MTFAYARRTDQEHIPALRNELTSSQFIDQGTVNGGIEAEVKVLQRTEFTELGLFVTPVNEPLMTDINLVLQE